MVGTFWSWIKNAQKLYYCYQGCSFPEWVCFTVQPPQLQEERKACQSMETKAKNTLFSFYLSFYLSLFLSWKGFFFFHCIKDTAIFSPILICKCVEIIWPLYWPNKQNLFVIKKCTPYFEFHLLNKYKIMFLKTFPILFVFLFSLCLPFSLY